MIEELGESIPGCVREKGMFEISADDERRGVETLVLRLERTGFAVPDSSSFLVFQTDLTTS